MGTNYYWHESGERECPHCKQETKSLHIGKSSFGWAFSLRIHPHEDIHDLDHWKLKWAGGGAIFDEYGEPVTVDEMLKIITQRGPGYYAREHGRLLRHVPENMGPGYGGHLKATCPDGVTYDLCNYEFS